MNIPGLGLQSRSSASAGNTVIVGAPQEGITALLRAVGVGDPMGVSRDYVTGPAVDYTVSTWLPWLAAGGLLVLGLLLLRRKGVA